MELRQLYVETYNKIISLIKNTTTETIVLRDADVGFELSVFMSCLSIFTLIKFKKDNYDNMRVCAEIMYPRTEDAEIQKRIDYRYDIYGKIFAGTHEPHAFCFTTFGAGEKMRNSGWNTRAVNVFLDLLVMAYPEQYFPTTPFMPHDPIEMAKFNDEVSFPVLETIADYIKKIEML